MLILYNSHYNFNYFKIESEGKLISFIRFCRKSGNIKNNNCKYNSRDFPTA